MAKISCAGKTTTGAECRAPAGPSGLCFFHANPEKARGLGQMGGRKNRHQMPEPPAASPVSATDLLVILAEAIQDVKARKITPRAAGALSQLCNSVHRILPTTDLEARLAKLEEQLSKQGSVTPGDTDLAIAGKDGENGNPASPRDGQRVDADAVNQMDNEDGADTGNDGSNEEGGS